MTTTTIYTQTTTVNNYYVLPATGGIILHSKSNDGKREPSQSHVITQASNEALLTQCPDIPKATMDLVLPQLIIPLHVDKVVQAIPKNSWCPKDPKAINGFQRVHTTLLDLRDRLFIEHRLLNTEFVSLSLTYVKEQRQGAEAHSNLEEAKGDALIAAHLIARLNRGIKTLQNIASKNNIPLLPEGTFATRSASYPKNHPMKLLHTYLDATQDSFNFSFFDLYFLADSEIQD